MERIGRGGHRVPARPAWRSATSSPGAGIDHVILEQGRHRRGVATSMGQLLPRHAQLERRPAGLPLRRRSTPTASWRETRSRRTSSATPVRSTLPCGPGSGVECRPWRDRRRASPSRRAPAQLQAPAAGRRHRRLPASAPHPRRRRPPHRAAAPGRGGVPRSAARCPTGDVLVDRQRPVRGPDRRGAAARPGGACTWRADARPGCRGAGPATTSSGGWLASGFMDQPADVAAGAGRAVHLEPARLRA